MVIIRYAIQTYVFILQHHGGFGGGDYLVWVMQSAYKVTSKWAIMILSDSYAEKASRLAVEVKSSHRKSSKTWLDLEENIFASPRYQDPPSSLVYLGNEAQAISYRRLMVDLE